MAMDAEEMYHRLVPTIQEMLDADELTDQQDGALAEALGLITGEVKKVEPVRFGALVVFPGSEAHTYLRKNFEEMGKALRRVSIDRRGEALIAVKFGEGMWTHSMSTKPGPTDADHDQATQEFEAELRAVRDRVQARAQEIADDRLGL